MNLKIEIDASCPFGIPGTEEWNTQRIQAKALPFTIEGKTFCRINGNDRDQEIMDAFPDLESRKITLEIIDEENKKHVCSLPTEINERLIRCISQGMRNFYPMYNWNQFYAYESFGVMPSRPDTSMLPTCAQFARYIKCGVTNDLEFSNYPVQRVNCTPTEKLQDFGFYEIIINNKPVHNFIHLTDKICIDKQTTHYILFKNFDHLLDDMSRRMTLSDKIALDYLDITTV